MPFLFSQRFWYNIFFIPKKLTVIATASDTHIDPYKTNLLLICMYAMPTNRNTTITKPLPIIAENGFSCFAGKTIPTMEKIITIPIIVKYKIKIPFIS